MNFHNISVHYGRSNAYGLQEFPLELLKLSTYVCPNETELERITGLSTKTEDEIVAAVKALQAQGAQNVLVTLGADGSMLVSQKGR